MAVAAAGPFASPDVFLRRGASTKLCWKTSINKPILVLVDLGCFWALTRDLCSGLGHSACVWSAWVVAVVGGWCLPLRIRAGARHRPPRRDVGGTPPPPKPPSDKIR